MKSPNQSHFAKAPQATIERSSFDRSHGYKTTFNAGRLIPIYCDEALPGDTISLNMTAFARLSTPIKPVMDNMYLESFFFAVPNRLLWTNWQRFNGEQLNPADTTDYLVPQMEAANYPQGGLGDYFGIPVNRAGVVINAFHHRAYNQIFNEFFRDENIQDSKPVNKGDGPDVLTDYAIYRRGKRHDYFTSCLPWPQKGVAVSIPLGGTAPITGEVFHSTPTSPNNMVMIHEPTNNITGTAVPAANENISHVNTLVADLSNATNVTINALRESFQIQRLYERDARGGTRYIEILKSHFKVTSPDSRLQRPEYLGGGSTPINFTQVAQTQSSDGTTPQGNLSAFATATGSNHSFTKSFVEHCTIIGMICVRADLTYQQGINRMFSRQTRWDYFWPALAHIGEQEVLNKEIFYNNDANDELIFGYQERYAEYRYKPSLITGAFRSDVPLSLDVWHLAQDFGNLPSLNETFIQESPPIDRIVAVPSEPDFIFDSYIKLKHVRPMPTYGVPGMMDHF